MVGTFTDFSSRAALAQLRSGPQSAVGNAPDVLLNTARGGRSSASSAAFTVDASLRSESNVLRSLGDGIGKARGVIAAANAGTQSVSESLDSVDRIISAVEGGASGATFKSAIDGIQRQTDTAIARSGFGGTNLLEEGQTLTITLGFAGNSSSEFRQLSIESQGLSPTAAAQQTTTETRVVTEEVQVDVTRGEVLEARVDKLTTKVERQESRQARLEAKAVKLTERQEKLTTRLDKLEQTETRLENRIDQVGGNPDDPTDAARLDQAKTYKSYAKTLEERGSTTLASFVNGVADSLAESAGLTVSLEKLEEFENRLAKTVERQEKTTASIESTSDRIDLIGERITQAEEKKTQLNDKIASTQDRLDNLSEDRLNQVVRTRTETVEREVEVEIENEQNVGFDGLFDLVQEKLSAGDTEGARAVVEEARGRIDRVQGQLERADTALDRRSGFLGEVSDRIDQSISTKVDENLTDDEAARRAAQVLTDIAKTGRLFGGEKVKDGILALFNSGAVSEDQSLAAADDEEDRSFGGFSDVDDGTGVAASQSVDGQTLSGADIQPF